MCRDSAVVQVVHSGARDNGDLGRDTSVTIWPPLLSHVSPPYHQFRLFPSMMFAEEEYDYYYEEALPQGPTREPPLPSGPTRRPGQATTQRPGRARPAALQQVLRWEWRHFILDFPHIVIFHP